MDGSTFKVTMHISPHPIPMWYVTIATISIFIVEVKRLDSFFKNIFILSPFISKLVFILHISIACRRVAYNLL